MAWNDRHGYNVIGRQTGATETLAQDVRDEAGQANSPQDDKGRTMSGSWMIRQCSHGLGRGWQCPEHRLTPPKNASAPSCRNIN
jgi:hypothetical protein